MKNSYVTVTDQFCGAGGSSIGAVKAGAELKLALNHWELAIRTHNSNFPNAAHDCTDISACDPRRYMSTDFLLTSPECTNHTLAKGKPRKWQKQLELYGAAQVDPAEERSRATMWDVVRFAEYHQYNVIIVENVVEARYWALWDAWLVAMQTLGYAYKCVFLNSMLAHPTPQSRDRMYVVFWKQGNRAPDLDIRPAAWCGRCARNTEAVQSWKNLGRQHGKYKQQYVYRCPVCAQQVIPYYFCAANAIDWSHPIERIADRKKPLKEKTLERIRVGLRKFGAQALAVELAYSHAQGNRSTVLSDALPTTTSRQTHGLMMPPYSGKGNHATPLSSTLPTQTTCQSQGLIVPPYLVEFRNNQDVARITDAISTICTSGSHHGLVVPPFLTSYYGSGGESAMQAAIPTVTTVDRHGLVVPPFLVGNYTPGWARPVSEPTGTITTSDHHSVVVPPFLMSYYTRMSGIGAAVSGVDEALPTQPTWPVHYVVEPGRIPEVEECGFRMLQPHEIQRAMAFPDDYTVLGAGRDKVKQLGNAVTPPVMELLFRRCLETLQ